MRIVGLDHVSVTCGDLERSLAFYAGLLGIPVRERGKLDPATIGRVLGREPVDGRFADLDLGSGRTLELLEFAGGQDAGRAHPVLRPGGGHLSLEVDDIGAAHDHLRAAGVALLTPSPVALEEPGFWHGCRIAYATDPDGMTVELIERPPPSEGP